MAVDVVFRAGAGLEARLLRQRPDGGRWTHVGLLFRDGWVYHCDARRGVCADPWDHFHRGKSRDLGRVILRCSRRREQRLRAVCEDMVGQGLAFADDYRDWQEAAGRHFYCTTFVCEVLARAADFFPLAPEAVAPQIIPLLGERRLLLPEPLYRALARSVDAGPLI